MRSATFYEMMEVELNAFTGIAELISEQMGVKASRIRLDSRLVQDFGMDGDDAGEFMASHLLHCAVEGKWN